MVNPKAVFTSKKVVSMRVKKNVYSAMVLSVLLHGAAESWALSRTQLSMLEILHNSWLRCITRDAVGSPESISTKDLVKNTHQLPISIMIKEIEMARTCSSSSEHQTTYFCYEGTRTYTACWTALWHLGALCYEGCEGHGSSGLP